MRYCELPISDCRFKQSAIGNRKSAIQYSSSSSSSSKLSSSTMSNSTGSSPTTSRSVPHSSHDTISPLSVSKSTWTSASHSGQVPVGTFYSSPAKVKAGIHPDRESIATLVSNQINLPASAGICNTLFSRSLAQARLHFYAKSISPTVVVHIDAHRTKPIGTQG